MRTLFAIFLLFSSLAFSAAGFPESISYQGILTDENGDIVADGEYTATFTLHGHSSAPDELWSEEKTFTTDDGVFNVVLGSDTPFTEDNYEFGDRGIWLEIQLQGENDPLDPRIEINSVPFSRAAYSIDNGKINNTEIGAESPAAATFTDISTSSSFFYIPNTISEGMVLVSNGDGSASWTTFSGGTDLTASETITIPNSVSEGEVLTADGNGNAYWQENNSSRLKVTTLNASATLSTEDQFVIITNANYDVTLPSNPAEGQLVKIFTNQNDPEIDPNGKSLFVTNQEFTTSQSIQQIATDAYDGLLDGRTPTDVSFTLLSDGTDWYIVSHSFDTVGGP